MVGLLGQRDELFRLIESSLDATPFVRGNEITVEGPDATRVGELINQLVLLLEEGHALDSANVGRAIDMVKADERPSEVLTAEVLRSARGRTVRPKTSGQKQYVDGQRSEEHTSELQSRLHLVCRLLLEKKKNEKPAVVTDTTTQSACL